MYKSGSREMPGKHEDLNFIKLLTQLLFEGIQSTHKKRRTFRVFWKSIKKMLLIILGEKMMHQLNASFIEINIKEHMKKYCGVKQPQHTKTSTFDTKILVLRGIAGSGKDYFAREFIEHCKEKKVHIDEDVHVAAFADQVKLITMMYLEPYLGPLRHKLFGVGTQAQKDELIFNNKTKSLRDFIKYLANNIFKPTFGDGIWATMLFNKSSELNFMLITDHRFEAEREVIDILFSRKNVLFIEIVYINNTVDNPFRELDETEKHYTVQHDRTPIDEDVKIVYEKCESRGFFKSFEDYNCRKETVDSPTLKGDTVENITELMQNQTLSL